MNAATSRPIGDSNWHASRTVQRPMSKSIIAFVVVPAVVGAAALAFYGVGRVPDATAAGPRPPARALEAAPADDMPFENGATLPPDHPPIGGTGAMHGSMPLADDEPPAIIWQMPPGWQEATNPNAMRLATYRVPGGVEVSVSRAGGAPEANIQRWIAQFDDVGGERRAEKTVHGLHVVTVDVSGTYVGGGVNMGGPAAARPDWAMVGAIVESRSPSYFFKMTGPAAAVRAARATFDRLINGIVPT